MEEWVTTNEAAKIKEVSLTQHRIAELARRGKVIAKRKEGEKRWWVKVTLNDGQYELARTMQSGKPHLVMDFNQISGPLSSKQDNFQELCSQLVLREYPEAKPVEGKGGDGILRVVWQAKFFCYPLKDLQKCQIKDFFGRVRQAPGITRWIFCLPRNLNTAEQEWFENLNRQHPGSVMRRAVVFLECWGETKLRTLLEKHPDIALKFFPALGEQRPEDSLIVHSLSAGGASIEFMLSNLSNNVVLV